MMITLCENMINETAGFGSISTENREKLKSFTGLFGAETDELISKFYDINTKVNNGGVPILKQIIDKMAYYEIKYVKSTNCLMLTHGNKLIDTLFLNSFAVMGMSLSDLTNEACKFANEKGLREYALNLTEF